MTIESIVSAEALIKRFGEGWMAGDADAVASVFTDGGVFVPAPHAAPVHGRDAIRKYWDGTALEQAETVFRFGEVYRAGPWFAVEFKCTFRRRRTGEPVDVRGALFCETEQDKVSEMRVYYHRTVKG